MQDKREISIAVIGLGLIGGSFARALSTQGYVVHGFDLDRRVLEAALESGAIASKLKEAKHYTVVCVALRPSATVKIARDLPFAIRAQVLCDVSGVKQGMYEKLVDLMSEGVVESYISLHPMAGKEVGGFEHSSSDLFTGASCVMSIPEGVDLHHIELVGRLLKDAGFTKIVEASAKDHDRIIAYTSQLAHVVSNSYVKSPLALYHDGFTGGSYQDLTRVSRMDADMWSELFLANSHNLLSEIDTLMQNLSQVRDAIASKDEMALRAILRRGSRMKESAQSLSKASPAPQYKSVRVWPSTLRGNVRIPSSKSAAHRMLIAAALSVGAGQIRFVNLDMSEDIRATLACLVELGAKVKLEGLDVVLEPVESLEKRHEHIRLEVKESGATLRMILPVASALADEVMVELGPELMARPLKPLLETLNSQGKSFEEHESGYILRGKLESGVFEICGDISSQFISGLLLAAPLLDGKSEVRLTTHLESSGYLDMTIQTMKEFGVAVDSALRADENFSFFVSEGQSYHPPLSELQVEADHSTAAIYKAAKKMGMRIILEGLEEESLQPDRALDNILKHYNQMPGHKPMVAGQPIDLKDVPDLFPVLAVFSAACRGISRFGGISRLTLKESDRIKSVEDLLDALGIEHYIEHGLFYIKGGSFKCAEELPTHGDHRLVMAATLAVLLMEEGSCKGVRILDADTVAKSYPRFFEDLKDLGARIDVDL